MRMHKNYSFKLVKFICVFVSARTIFLCFCDICEMHLRWVMDGGPQYFDRINLSRSFRIKGNNDGDIEKPRVVLYCVHIVFELGDFYRTFQAAV